MRGCNLSFAFVIMLAVGLGDLRITLANAGDVVVQPMSLVDYLKAQQQPSSPEARGELFGAKFPGEKYEKTADQNTRLLQRLIADRADAVAEMASATAALAKALATKSETANASDTFTCFSWLPVEGVGIHASYSLRIDVAVANGVIPKQGIRVALASGAKDFGTIEFACSFRVMVDRTVNGKTVTEIAKLMSLEPAWFPTIGSPDDPNTYLFGPKDAEITLPTTGTVRFEVEAHPALVVDGGRNLMAQCIRSVRRPK